MESHIPKRPAASIPGGLARRALVGLCLAVALALGPAAPARLNASEAASDPRLEEIRRHIEDQGHHWIAGPTGVSRLPPEQFHRLLGARMPPDYAERLEKVRATSPSYSAAYLPARFDWTDSAAVSPVRDQMCGDCWAQASVAALESRLRIDDGDSTLLSVQQAIDCNYGGSSCDGGSAGSVYDLYRVIGAVRQISYPYVGRDRSCQEDTCEIVARIDRWAYIDTTVASVKTHLLAGGPLAAGMGAYDDIAYYTGGCYECGAAVSANHLVLIVGWDDSLCDGQGAWHVKNSWGTDWGEDGYFWIRYGSCGIGVGSTVIDYEPRQGVSLACLSWALDDAEGDGDGRADPGETVLLAISITNSRWQTATNVSAALATASAGVDVTDGAATFPDVPPGQAVQSDPPHFAFAVAPSSPCGARLDFVLSLTCDQGVFTDHFDLLVGDAQTAFADDSEDDRGWSLSAADDGATSGRWSRKNPNGSLLDSVLVQCELDHSPGAGAKCFVTENFLRRYPPDAADVDSGKTTIATPAVDLSAYASARLSYARWYTNATGPAPADDAWQVDVSADSGATWSPLERDIEDRREWAVLDFDLADHTDLTGGVRVRFVASDFGQESTVEAAVDDIRITGCPQEVDVVGPSVTLEAPNGGEEITEGAEYQVAWHASDDYGIRQFTVLASYDGGTTYPDTIAVTGGRDSTVVWQVPSGEHPACAVRVEALDRGHNLAFDESDTTFAIALGGAGVIVIPETDLPDRAGLIGCGRNPFTGSTHIFYGLPLAADVHIAVYDTAGRVVREVLRGTIQAGYHSTVWDATSDSRDTVAAGVYFVRFESGGTSQTAKVVLLQ
jgi:hypothetical protein